MEIYRAQQAKLLTKEERAQLIANDRAALGMSGKNVKAGGGTTTPAANATSTTAVRPAPVTAEPEEDTGKTWGGPTSTKELNFGHPTVNGKLFSVLPSGRLAFEDNGKLLNKDQWANMPEFQKTRLKELVKSQYPDKLPAFEKAMRGGDAAKAHTQPKVDNSQVSPVAAAAAEINAATQAPGSVADRARAAALAKVTQAQSATVQNVSRRINDLAMAKVDLLPDLSNPAKQAEAQARIHLLDAQITDLQQVQSRVQGYKLPANLNARDAAVVEDTFRQIDAEIPNFSNPSKKGETEGVLSVLFSHLDNPGLADRRDPVIINQAVTAQNLQQRIDDLLGAKNDLIKDLGDPKKQAEAQARMQLLDQQIFQVTDVLNRVEEYRRPANLTGEQAAHVAETFHEINELARDLSNPRKNARAQGELTRLFADLNEYAAAPAAPAPAPTPAPAAGGGELRALQEQFNASKEQIRAANEQFRAAYATGNREAIATGASELLKQLQASLGLLEQIEAKVPEANRTPKQNQRIATEKEHLIRSQTNVVNFLKQLQG